MKLRHLFGGLIAVVILAGLALLSMLINWLFTGEFFHDA